MTAEERLFEELGEALTKLYDGKTDQEQIELADTVVGLAACIDKSRIEAAERKRV